VNSGEIFLEHSNYTTLQYAEDVFASNHRLLRNRNMLKTNFQSLAQIGMIFNLTMKLRSNILNITSKGESSNHTPAFGHPIYLLRIPKASSTSMSVVARRMVGCEPPGPCCSMLSKRKLYKCPLEGLSKCASEGRVIGCNDHNPRPIVLKNNSTPTFSMIRHPHSRSISGFFYPGDTPGFHHNESCTDGIEICFVKYTKSAKWQNVAVKMLTGGGPYRPSITCERKEQCTHSLEEALNNVNFIAFIGVTELWELSLAVLHLTWPQFEPKLEEFHTTERDTKDMKDITEIRRNIVPILRRKYQHLLNHQNSLDLILYAHVVEKLCIAVHRLGLWQHDFVREYWRAKVVAVKGRDTNLCS